MNPFTRAARSGYDSAVAVIAAAGICSPDGAAMSREQYATRLFCRLGVSSNGRPGGRSRKARRCSTGLQTSVPVAHPFCSGLAVNHRNWSTTMPNTAPRAAVRKTSAPLPFFACGADTALFSVNTGVPLDALLDNAQTFMVSVEAAVLHAAEETDTPATWGAYYLAQMAGALLESLQQEMLEGRRHD